MITQYDVHPTVERVMLFNHFSDILLCWPSDLLLTPKFSSKDGKVESQKVALKLMDGFVFQDLVYNLKCQSDNFVRRRKWDRIIKYSHFKQNSSDI